MIEISNKLVYKTVKNEARELLVEKKSKFIASVMPCKTEEEALEYLGEIKKEFSDATHNVYAYVIDENQIFRYSDDGEPSQTAGMPVLDVIRKEGLVDVIVVVTRYFGGTLLGTGGLVHAYSNSASMGLRAANIITRMLSNIIAIKVDYNLVGKIQHKIATDHLILEDTLYEENVTFVVCILPEKTQKFIDDITELTNGNMEWEIIDTRYVEV